QLKPVLRPEKLPIAVLCDRLTPHVLHHKVRPAIVSDAAIEDGSDGGVIHDRQRLALDIEPRDDLFGVHPSLDHFERDLATDRLLLFGKPDNTHSAYAEALLQSVRTDHAVMT